jgi:Zn-dependent protease
MESPLNWPPSWATLLYLPALFVAFTVHELAHALVAFLLGDTSQVERKRLSFNPLRHVSWVGMIVFLLFGFGWAKPVWVDPSRFAMKNRALGSFLVSIAGATANLLLAIVVLVGVVMTLIISSALTGASMWDASMFLMPQDLDLDLRGVAVALSTYMVWVNLVLAVFNLVPIPPLDGFQAVVSLIATVRYGLKRGDATPAPRWVARTAAKEEATLSPAQIHFNIGLDYHREEQLDEAIARYRQAIAHDDGFSLAYYNLGLAYLGQGRSSLAGSAFRATIRTSPDMNVRLQADLRLRELARTEQETPVEPESLPPPLDPGAISAPDAGAHALDPAVVRRVWLQLIAGGTVMVLAAIAIWFYVTGVTVMAML